jgi:hypothetical protein
MQKTVSQNTRLQKIFCDDVFANGIKSDRSNINNINIIFYDAIYYNQLDNQQINLT